MERQVFIKKQFALQEREYTTENGEKKKFASMGFLLTDFMDTFYAEMTGNMARECGELDRTVGYMLQSEMQVRAWETQDHRTAYATSIYINRLKPMVWGEEDKQ
jgi:hypothetical protein